MIAEPSILIQMSLSLDLSLRVVHLDKWFMVLLCSSWPGAREKPHAQGPQTAFNSLDLMHRGTGIAKPKVSLTLRLA